MNREHVFPLHLCGLDVHSRHRKALCLEIARHVLGWMAVCAPRKDSSPSKHGIEKKATKNVQSRKSKTTHTNLSEAKGRIRWNDEQYTYDCMVCIYLQHPQIIDATGPPLSWMGSVAATSSQSSPNRLLESSTLPAAVLNNLDMCLMCEDLHTMLLSM